MSSRTATRVSSLLLFFVLAFLGVFLPLAAALPVTELEKRDVYAPPILSPHAGTVWRHGESQNVTWDVSSPPENITNPYGLIYLRKGGVSTPVILANGFDITWGRVQVLVPWVFDGDDYSIVLMGDSGNWSQDFTIKQ